MRHIVCDAPAPQAERDLQSSSETAICMIPFLRGYGHDPARATRVALTLNSLGANAKSLDANLVPHVKTGQADAESGFRR